MNLQQAMKNPMGVFGTPEKLEASEEFAVEEKRNEAKLPKRRQGGRHAIGEYLRYFYQRTYGVEVFLRDHLKYEYTTPAGLKRDT